MSLYPPGARMPSVEKLVWQPAPFQSPSLGLGEMLQITPWLSVTRSMMYRAMERSWPNLVFPLAWHHFSIGPCNLYTCSKALYVVLVR